MATYIILGNFTEQGIKNIKQTTDRADAIRKLAEKFNITVKDFYWTFGQYDVATILEASDDAAVLQLMLTIGAAGNVRTQTIRVFTQPEIAAVTAKL